MTRAAWIRGVGAGVGCVLLAIGAWLVLRPPSDDDRRAELARWSRSADGACDKAFDRIVSRGPALDIVDLDRVVVRAAGDLRRAIAAIRRLGVPDGSEKLIGPVRAQLAPLERDLAALGKATEKADRERLRALSGSIRHDVQDFVNAAGDAGLRRCAPLGLPSLASDTVTAPVFAQEFAAFDAKFARRLKANGRRRVDTPKELIASVKDAAAIFGDSRHDFGALTPPVRATTAARAYDDVLAGAARMLRRAAKGLRPDKPPSRAEVSALDRGLKRVGRQIVKRSRSLLRAAQAQPIGRPEAEPEAELSAQPA